MHVLLDAGMRCLNCRDVTTGVKLSTHAAVMSSVTQTAAWNTFVLLIFVLLTIGSFLNCVSRVTFEINRVTRVMQRFAT